MNFDTRIDDLEFSVRTRNCFKNAGIETVFDLLGKTERELLSIPNFGVRSLAEVKEFLNEYRQTRVAIRKLESFTIEECLQHIVKTVEIILDKLDNETP